MDHGFSNKQDWFTAGWALAIWFAHFNLLWAASSTFPGQPMARWLALILTIVAAIILFWLWRRAGNPGIFKVPGLGLALAAMGVAFGAVPAAIG